MQEVTIVIPNYNGKRLLENCLKTLEQQTYKDFKVLVVDNGSSDGSTEVSSEKLELEIVSLKENLGFCGAVNLGIQKTKTPYLILLIMTQRQTGILLKNCWQESKNRSAFFPVERR